MAERGRKIDSKFREELKREIKEELLKELQDKKINPVIVHEKEESFEKNSKKPVKLLIALVLIVLILDFAIVLLYYNPNFFKTNGLVIRGDNDSKVITGDCSDGTVQNTCSKTKPYYCLNGKLVEAAYNCGCPNGFVRQFQKCAEV